MLKVIGAGFGRTGTTSVKAALETLGFGPCFHMSELSARPALVDGWLRRVTGEPVRWAALFDGYAATVDWPAAAFWRELSETYPDAKVLLTVRDPRRWYDSMAATIFRMRYTDAASMPPAMRRLFESRPGVEDQFRMVEKLIWQDTFGGRFADRDHAIRVFREHIAEVRAAIAPERLLEYDVADGWDPLCAFLGTHVPAEPFPHLNTSASVQHRLG